MSLETTSLAAAPRRANRLTYLHFRALDHALLHADLTAAREAFSNLQDDSPHLAAIVHAIPIQGESPRRISLQQLAQALHKGELPAAQLAFSQFQVNATVDSRHPY